MNSYTLILDQKHVVQERWRWISCQL